MVVTGQGGGVVRRRWPGEADPRSASGSACSPRLATTAMRGVSPFRRLATAALLALVPALGACGSADAGSGPHIPGADPDRGRQLISAYGCGACHVIPHVSGARGQLGPPLTQWRQRAFVAGVLPNAPAYLERWIMTPQAVVPGNAMPDMGVTQRDAADIAAYLYTIR